MTSTADNASVEADYSAIELALIDPISHHSPFAHFLGSFEELPSQLPCFYCFRQRWRYPPLPFLTIAKR